MCGFTSDGRAVRPVAVAGTFVSANGQAGVVFTPILNHHCVDDLYDSHLRLPDRCSISGGILVHAYTVFCFSDSGQLFLVRPFHDDHVVVQACGGSDPDVENGQ